MSLHFIMLIYKQLRHSLPIKIGIKGHMTASKTRFNHFFLNRIAYTSLLNRLPFYL